MFQSPDLFDDEHDWRLVIVAGVVCFLASFTAISMFNRARATEDRARASWIVAAGAATGCGIWATHFIAMLAYEPGISVAYNLGLTALSLLAAVVVTGVGLSVAVYALALGRGHRGAIVGAASPVCTIRHVGLELPGRITWVAGPRAVSILLGMASAWRRSPRVRLDGRRTIAPRGAAADPRDRLAPFHRDGRGGDRSRSDACHHRVVAVAGLAALQSQARPSPCWHGLISAHSPTTGSASKGTCSRPRRTHVPGLNMFDGEGAAYRLQRPLRQMYRLSPEQTQPGCYRSQILSPHFARASSTGTSSNTSRRPCGGSTRQAASTDRADPADGRMIRSVEPADCRRRAGGHARGRYRAAGARSAANALFGAGKTAGPDRRGDRSDSATASKRPEDRQRQRHHHEIDRHGAFRSSGETSHRAAGAVQTSNEASANVGAAAAAADELLSSIAEISRQLRQATELVRAR